MARNKRHILILFVLSVLFLLQTGCDRSFDALTVDGFTLEQAKHFHMEHAADLRLPGTGGGSVKSSIDYNEILVPQWDKATYYEVQFPSKLARTYEVPLNTGSIVGGVLLKENATEHDVVTMKSSLIIQEFSQGEKTSNRQMVVTVLGEDGDNDTSGDVFTYMGSHKDFTGFMIVSTPAGEIVNIFQYLYGQRSVVYVRNTDDSPINAPLSGFSFLKVQGTKSSYGNSEPGICQECGKSGLVYVEYGMCENCIYAWEEELGEIVVTPRCPYCGQPEKECCCILCGRCGKPEDLCRCKTEDNPSMGCEYCGGLTCNGECRECGGGDLPSSSQDTVKSFYVEVRSNYSHMGYCTGGGGPFDMNKEVEVCAIAYPGHMFGGWTEYGAILDFRVSYTFAITSNRCLVANFFDESSECAKLTTKYTNNNALKSSISMLLNKKMENDSIEHGVCRIIGSSDSKYYKGNSKGVKIQFIDGVYESCIHNHPSNKLMMSIGDLYGMYKLYENNNYSIGTPLMVLTDDGILSFEIEDIQIFSNYINSIIPTDNPDLVNEYIKNYQKDFEKLIIGVSKGASINDQIYFNKAIEFFSQKGLKIFHTFDIEGSGIWEYAKIANGKLSFINCYDNY